jgi:hypothetical protein
MFDEPITTIQQAKEFFRAMGCSHFHMDREYPDRAREYDHLKISKQTEKEWVQEQFDEYYAKIMESSDVNSLWMLHSAMEGLLASIKSQTALLKMLEVTKFIRDKVPPEDRIIVAETINGRTIRSARQGLIYLAYDWNNIQAAKEFVDLSLYFSKYDEQKNRGYERCISAIKLCNEIQRELKL